MTVRELIDKLLDLPMNREVLLCYKKEFVDERGEKCNGYIFHIDDVRNDEIIFTDWRDKVESKGNGTHIELSIKIPEEVYREIKDGFYSENLRKMAIAIGNGTPLPDNHGKLIDADSLIKTIEEKAKRLRNADTINGLCGAVALIFDEPAIIAGTESEEPDENSN